MVYPLHARHFFAAGFAVLALSGTAAKADVIYTITTTGTLVDGTSEGTFGASGTNLAGMTYTATQTFDATLSSFGQTGTDYEQLYPALSSASITVGGQTFNINSNAADNRYYISSRAGGYSTDIILADTNTYLYDGYLDVDIETNLLTFLQSDSLSQSLYYTVPGSGFHYNTVSFYAPDNTYFDATVSTISLNGGAAPAPEPRSIALFGAGLVGLAWLRRRKTA